MRKNETLLGIPAGVAWIGVAILYCCIGLCVLAVVWPICLIMVFLEKGQWPARKKPLDEKITGQQSPPNKVATMHITAPMLKP